MDNDKKLEFEKTASRIIESVGRCNNTPRLYAAKMLAESLRYLEIVKYIGKGFKFTDAINDEASALQLQHVDKYRFRHFVEKFI